MKRQCQEEKKKSTRISPGFPVLVRLNENAQGFKKDFQLEVFVGENAQCFMKDFQLGVVGGGGERMKREMFIH